jgi:DNA invertase Pin-like site-specific DNA recombinase
LPITDGILFHRPPGIAALILGLDGSQHLTNDHTMPKLLHRFARWLLRNSAPAYLPGPTTNFLDAYRQRRPPTANDLLAELKNTAWTCASINASVCASMPPKLYVSTGATQSLPRCATRSLDPTFVTQLKSRRPQLAQQTIEEVVDHPLLTLFRQVNPVHNSFMMWTITRTNSTIPSFWHFRCFFQRFSMKRAISYIRFSTPEQLKGDSLRRQLEWGVNLCKTKDWYLDESLSLRDLGKSAYHGANAVKGALGAFLKAIESRKVKPGDVLIVESIDRLSRERIDDAYELFRRILKTGVEIYTREPERHYTKESLNQIFSIMEALIYMERANNESATKSMRGLEYWKKARKGLAEKKPIHHFAPMWLQLSADKDKFIAIPAAVAAIRTIYKWAGEGLGLNGITKKLNAEGVPTFAKRDTWRRSYIAKLLQDRAVMGEYQPHIIKDGKRVPHGDPVPGYFPTVITEKEWYAVRNAVKGRGQKQRGRKGVLVANLFTGLIRDARDGKVMHLSYVGASRKNNTRVLVSYGARNGEKDSVDKHFPYDKLERSVLLMVRELKADFLNGHSNRETEIMALVAKLDELNHNIAVTQKSGKKIESILQLLEQLDEKKKAIVEQLEHLKTTSHDPSSALMECQPVIAILDTAEQAEKELLRTKIKAYIRQIVSEMWLIAWDEEDHRLAELQIFFTSGRIRTIFFEWIRRGRERGKIHAITGNRVTKGKVMAEPSVMAIPPTSDLRNYRNPKFGRWYDK